MNNNKLADWINKELEKRGWSCSEASRQGGISHTSISQTVSGRQPGVDVCKGLAKAFNTPVETVYRLAGLLPEISDLDKMDMIELVDVFRDLGPDQREMVLKMAREFRAQRQRE